MDGTEQNPRQSVHLLHRAAGRVVADRAAQEDREGQVPGGLQAAPSMPTGPAVYSKP